jgi:hypothetical protein
MLLHSIYSFNVKHYEKVSRSCPSQKINAWVNGPVTVPSREAKTGAARMTDASNYTPFQSFFRGLLGLDILEKRFDALEKRLDNFETHVDDRFDNVDDRLDNLLQVVLKKSDLKE